MFEALSRGLATLKLHKKSILLPYLANLLVGLTLAVPFALQFEAMLDESAYQVQMLEGMDFVWTEWFRDNTDGPSSTFGPTLVGIAPFLHHLELILTGKLHRAPVLLLTVGALYLFLQSFMTAAILGSLANDPGGTTVREFLRNGSEFFGRILRVRLLSFSVLGAGILAIGLTLAERVGNLARAAPTDRRAFLIAIGFQAAVLVVILCFKLISDYASITVTIQDRSSVFLGYLSALGFCLSNFLPAAGLYLSLLVIGVLWALLQVGLDSLIRQTSELGILCGLLVQQVYMGGRLALRAGFLSSQTHFFLQRERLARPDGEGVGDSSSLQVS